MNETSSVDKCAECGRPVELVYWQENGKKYCCYACAIVNAYGRYRTTYGPDESVMQAALGTWKIVSAPRPDDT